MDKQLAVWSWPALGAVGGTPSLLRAPHTPSLLYYDLQENQVVVKHRKIKLLLFGTAHLHSALEDVIIQDPGNRVFHLERQYTRKNKHSTNQVLEKENGAIQRANNGVTSF